MLMNRKCLLLLLICAVGCCLEANAQSGSIVEMEYWLDGQYANKQPLTSTTAEIDIGDLSPGFHHISVRSKDNQGTWGSAQTKFFVIPRITETATITHYCYWFDDDRQDATIQTSTNPIDLLELDLSGLSYFTEHTLYIAVCDSKGVYSNIWEETLFYEPITTGMEPLHDRVQNEDWYSLDGRKLNGRPTERGIYIHNGRKVIMK